MRPASSLMDQTNWTSCDLYDAHEGALRVFLPGLNSYGGLTRFSGEVKTARCFGDNSVVKATLASEGRGRVLVVDGGGSLHHALMGDLIAQSAIDHGWAGVIIEGCVRDTKVLGEMQLGVLALGAIPRKSVRRGEGEVDVEIGIRGVVLRSGDHIYVDEDGAIVSEKPLLGE